MRVTAGSARSQFTGYRPAEPNIGVARRPFRESTILKVATVTSRDLHSVLCPSPKRRQRSTPDESVRFLHPKRSQFVIRLNDMRRQRPTAYAIIGAVLLWFAYLTTQYTRHRMTMREIASELRMEYRKFYILPEPITPAASVPGEERLLVVGGSSDDFLVCSIVRNPEFDDWRGQWKVDCCYRPDLDPKHPRTPIWEPMDHFPNAKDLQQFRATALKQRWVTWDCPQGTDPSDDG